MWTQEFTYVQASLMSAYLFASPTKWSFFAFMLEIQLLIWLIIQQSFLNNQLSFFR